MTPLADSYRYCEDVARREAKNFYPAFRILPKPQRLAMCALYTFSRIADDIGDEPGLAQEKAANLNAWRRGLHDAVAGRFDHPCHPALADTIRTHAIPLEPLDAIIDGVEMDLGELHIQTWEDLKVYCYRVASAVGLACVRVWGCENPAATPFAVDAGYAFQLTNILRDVKEDADRGRVYLPAEDLARFGYDPIGFTRGIRDRSFRDLMAFQSARAQDLYARSEPLVGLLPPPGRAVFLMMSRTYRELLNEIERRDFDVFSARVRVSSWKKLGFALSVLPVRFGWRSGDR